MPGIAIGRRTKAAAWRCSARAADAMVDSRENLKARPLNLESKRLSVQGFRWLCVPLSLLQLRQRQASSSGFAVLWTGLLYSLLVFTSKMHQ